ncbi:MAG TPA: class I SAM-dependent methyltransferase [Candidatus Sulfotelmatobacter sp.]|nr:class I SAM-dependent methyltransferase [Candidatus Sulfotelmatobacter sp.]
MSRIEETAARASADEPTAVACPACREAEARSAFAKDGYALRRCRACGFLFVSPYPSEAELAAYYNDSARAPTANFFNKAVSRRRRAWVRSLKFLPYVVGRSVLDIGCGGGFMAGAFARLGARASGLDIGSGAIAYARRHFPRCTFYCEPFADFRGRGLRFDFVFSSELLEHLPGPDGFLETLAAVTKPGGHVYVSAPDAGHPAVPADVSRWSDVIPPEHLQFFNRGNAELAFARYGFRLVKAYRKRTPALSLIFRRDARP